MAEVIEEDRKKAEEMVAHFNDRRLIPKRGYSLRVEDKAYLKQFILEALEKAREEGHKKGRAEIERELMAELRDPAGTIWEHAKKLQDKCDALEKKVSAAREG